MSASLDPVAQQYENWVYPLPIDDLAAFCAGGLTDGMAPCKNHVLYWPDGWYKNSANEAIDILVAGCGSNSAARYAYTHPNARVWGIDLSAASLAHEQVLKDKHQLKNLTLAQLRVEDVASLGQHFDFIDAVGVLHHLPQPEEGLQALKSVLRPHGVIGIMLYGQYGRAGVYALQTLFKALGLGQTVADVELVRETLAFLPKEHMAQHLFFAHNPDDLHYDAGLVDLFLHPQDQAYTVAGCLEYIERCGLHFQGWVDNFWYYPDGLLLPLSQLYQRIAALPQQQQWAVMELFSGCLGQHAFYVCHPERDKQTYDIQLDGQAWLQYTPVARSFDIIPEDSVTQQPARLKRRHFPPTLLTPFHLQLLQAMDGQRSVQGCLEEVKLTPQSPLWSAGLAWFHKLWRLGHIVFQL